MALLEIKNLSFSYPEAEAPALKAVDLSVCEGEFVLLAGPSGCGKSTLLRQLKPALAPFGSVGGAVIFDGEPVERLTLRQQAAEIGFVMQDPEMQLVTDKVWHELAFGLENLGTDQRTMRVRVAEIANFFGIQGWFNSPVASLSGGQKQLVCLASVMVMQPKLLILDEPTSQLDPIAANEFFDTLKRINQELGTTIIITEHRLESLFPIVDRVVFMRDGGVFLAAEPRECAKALVDDAEFLSVLPTTMRVFAATKPDGAAFSDAPLTVREGREYVKAALNAAKNVPDLACAEQDGGRTRLNKNGASEGSPVISVREVWFRYEKNSPDILKGLSLDIHAGELLCLIGGNGAGKTTAVMTASGMYRPYRGKVLLNNKPIASAVGGRVGVLLQNPILSFVTDSVLSELQLVLKKHRLPESRLDEIVRLMALDDILNRNPYDISGGELQRAAIARLLIAEPQVLFLDEATKGMDAFFKAQFGELLRRLCAKGVAVVLVSHDIEFCAEYADRLAMLFDGSVIASGSPKAVLAGNSFYTTTAGRIARGLIPSGAVTADELISTLKRAKTSDI